MLFLFGVDWRTDRDWGCELKAPASAILGPSSWDDGRNRVILPSK